MRLAWMSPILFIGAVIIGVILSFAVTAFTSPHPVEQPVVVITPIPTPAPVYITPEPTKMSIPATMAPLPTPTGGTTTFYKAQQDIADTMTAAMNIMMLIMVIIPAGLILSLVIGAFRQDD